MKFRNEYWFCSNFYPSPVYGYPTVEHAYQAAKTTDLTERRKIRAAKSPGEAKRLGRKVQLRADWVEIKDTVMETLLRQKFAEPSLRKILLETGEVELIEENNWHDNYWGECSCAKCQGRGKNRLGKLLMKIRSELTSDNELF